MNAPAAFQMRMDEAINRHNLSEVCKVYIDNLLIFSSSFEEHLEHLERVFNMLEDIGMKMHPENSIFCCEEVEFLGHMVSASGMSPSKAKVKAIRDLPIPTNVPALRRVLGFMNYYRCFVPKFSEIAKPLNNLLKKTVAWLWREEVEGPTL